MVLEMENSRRSFDRPRDPSLIKKPRLAEETARPPNPTGRPFANQRQIGSVAGPISRIRGSIRDTEINDSSREAYQPQPVNPHHELVNQYRTALAELTFNSKPIITNLTIIAGENLHAAKAVTTTICNNILEVETTVKWRLDPSIPSRWWSSFQKVESDVWIPLPWIKADPKPDRMDNLIQEIGKKLCFPEPLLSPDILVKLVPSEQKLPSLYLLDSIVKNIGRDYIKFFAARLPEVFCKAYRQVDPSTHSSMRHLFGTWKGVFPPQTLQMIEKELGFASKTDGSSSEITSRVDPRTRPPHSIHVNPKYLEQQRLQQSGRGKGMVNDVPGILTRSAGGVDRPERSGLSDGRSWISPSVKLNSIQRAQRGALVEPLQEKNVGEASGEHGYGFDSRHSLFETRKTGGRIADQGRDKACVLSGSNVAGSNVSDTTGLRDGSNTKRRIANYSTTKSASTDMPLAGAQSGASRISGGLSNSWKNSEEEEFMWDMHSRLSESDIANLSSNSKHDPWTPVEPEILDSENGLMRPPSIRDPISSFDPEALTNSLASEHGNPIGYCRSTLSRRMEVGLLRSGSSVNNAASSESFTPAIGRLPPITVAPNFGGGEIRPQTGSTSTVGQQFQSLSTESSMHQRLSSPPLAMHRSTQLQSFSEQDYEDPLSKNDLRVSQFSSKSNNFGTKDCLPTLPLDSPFNDLHSFESEDLGAGTPTSGLSNSPAADFSEQSSTSSLLAAVMKSDFLSNIIGTGVDNKDFENKGKPILRSSAPTVVSGASVGMISHDSIASQTKVEQSPLTCGAPSSSLAAATTESLDMKNKTSDPISNLLNSLVSKGLISASKSESPPAMLQKSTPVPQQKSPAVVILQKPATAVSQQKSSAAARQQKSSLGTPQQKAPPSLPHQKLPGAVPRQKLPTAVPRQNSPPAMPSQKFPHAVQQQKSPFPVLQQKSTPVVPKRKSPPLVPPSIPSQSRSQSLENLTRSSVPASSHVLPVASVEKVSSKASTGKVSSPPQSTSTEIENLIGFQFKPDVVRKFHASIISSLFEDLPHQCNLCGVHLKHAEQLDRHLQWHAKEKLDIDIPDKQPRGWYVTADEWVSGTPRPLGSESFSSMEELGRIIDSGPTVPVDENQYACILCGELFKEFFCQERDQWMFKGADYLPIPPAAADVGTVEGSAAKSLIVHAKCMTESSMHDLGFISGVKQENDV